MMSILTIPSPRAPARAKTLQDLLEGLGGIPPERVRADPPPGTATEQDVIAAEARDNSLCELVDGTLVEKAMGFRESVLTVFLLRLIAEFVDSHDLGVVAGAAG